MRNQQFKLWRPSPKPSLPGYFLITLVALLAGISLHAQTTVTTLAGGKPTKYYGYADGNTLQSLFHTPCGLAIDGTGENLYVADRDNNLVRYLDLTTKLTWTMDLEPTNMVSKPVGIVLDNVEDALVVLNRGNGTNGSVVSFDEFGNVIATNATQLTNAWGITIDYAGNLYVTAQSNTIIKITADGFRSNLATLPMPGTYLQGIVALYNGQLAVCDAGRNGIYMVDPNVGFVTTNAGFNGVGDFKTNSNDFASVAQAKFNQPSSIAEAGDGSLIVADYGNNRIKVISNGTVTNLAGVSEKYWYGTYPGWMDGPVNIPDSNPTNAESRLPFGVAFSPDGTVYISEDFYHTIRKVTGAAFGLPPPPPAQVVAPQIGYVDFPGNTSPEYTSVFQSITNATFNNDQPIIIAGVAGSQTYYTYSNTAVIGLVPNPTSASASVASGYQNGLFTGQLSPYTVAGTAPYVAIKAISENSDGAPNSAIAEAVIQYVAGNPAIQGNNAAQFTVSDVTSNALLYYTTDGSDPESSPAVQVQSLTIDTNTSTFNATFNFPFNNFLFKVFARKPNYQDSLEASNYFSAANFIPNRITFGLTNGQPSSTFIARPGQYYYAPVTLQLQPGGDTVYSLQFNLAVTNGVATTHQILNDAGFNFSSMLVSAVDPDEGDHYPPGGGQWYLDIPPIVGSLFTSSLFTNDSENLLGVGWLFRTGFKYENLPPNTPAIDFDTASQDLITYSIAHDTLFPKSAGVVVLGAYSFQIPTNASINDTYDIQIGSPSGTRDGVGAPGADVYIQAPAYSTVVTVGTPSYLVGDAAPFRWLNAGDFGDSNLDNADVQQVYQSAIEGVDVPPANSDLFAAMDSSGTMGAYDNVNQYYTNTSVYASLAAMFNGNDLTINTNCFGDGILDVSDVYVTFRRSEDHDLVWFRRYWTNGQFVAVPTPNLAFNSNSPAPAILEAPLATKLTSPSDTNAPNTNAPAPNPQNSSVTFNAGDSPANAGQTVSIPITASVFGDYPIMQVVGLNLAVEALDGSPTITQTVQFNSGVALGAPTIFAQGYAANYSAAWLSNSVVGLTGTNALIGTLIVSIPTNATANSAYSIHFNHASGSPYGLGSFPNQKFTGLITLSSRTNSYYNDGIPDSWRLRWFGTIYNALSQSNAVAAGDGVNNWQKYIAGVDPTIPNDFPQLNPKSTIPAGSTTAIHWPSVSGVQYVVMRSPNLFSGSWSVLSTNIGTGGDMEYDDTSTTQTKFYRVLIQQ